MYSPSTTDRETDFREIVNEVIHKHKMRKKTVALIGMTWLSLIALSEIVAWWNINLLWLFLPILITCIICIIIFACMLIDHLINIAQEKQEQRKKRERQEKGY